ncbi:hypothetical protein [Hymenobacter pini]|uniref:hypothetical protein n=1 Tax=Hymenobacter pini TaxID=2880879 RepID=UPI001CF21035|nr:hypothetical protein [Hymenobacter pini]MCA8830560.1 hypothetical protein [Hymenobacter pini]
MSTIRLYSSSEPAAQAFAKTLAENLSGPVEVLPLSQLPPPDKMHLQRLRTERKDLARELQTCRDMIALYSQVPSMGPETDDLQAEARKYEARIQEIDGVLNQEGGVAA